MNVFQRLEKAQREAAAVPMLGRHGQHGYPYAKAEDVARIGRAAIMAAGLTLYRVSARIVAPPGLGYSVLESTWQLSAVGTTPLETLQVSASVPIEVEKGRGANTAANIAATWTEADVLRSLLLLETEPATEGEQRRQPARRQQPATEGRQEAAAARERPLPSDSMRRPLLGKIAGSLAARLDGWGALTEAQRLEKAWAWCCLKQDAEGGPLNAERMRKLLERIEADRQTLTA